MCVCVCIYIRITKELHGHLKWDVTSRCVVGCAESENLPVCARSVTQKKKKEEKDKTKGKEHYYKVMRD